jgi:hypothetical protein
MFWRIAFMKSTIQRVLFAVAVATFGAGAVGTASAQTSSAPAAAPQHHGHGHFRHFGGGQFVGTLLRATKQLGLTPTEQSNIKNALASNRPHRQPGTQPQGPALTTIGNPLSSGFTAAVQNAESNASARVQKESQLALAIYDSLSPAHQTALPGVLAQMQAKEEARRAAWAAKHATSNG